MLGSNDSEIIVRSTIDLGHSLKRLVIVEGVESHALWARLLELGCDAAQGYFISEPMPAEKFRDWQRYSIRTDSELDFGHSTAVKAKRTGS
jgi:EAL domain-containing protein (putative c-di-GMP-specific phosphodiesterase class I)